MATGAQAITDELLALLSPSARAALTAELSGNAKAKEMLEQGLTFRKSYLEGDLEEPPKVETKVDVTPKVDPAPAAGAGNDLSSLTAELQKLNTRLSSVDEQFKNVIKKEDLPTLRGQLLETTIRNAHQAMRIELKHSQEFPGETFDLNKVSEHIEAAKKTGKAFANLEEAYDDMVREKRIEAKIAKGIEEGLKQKKSGETVPGQDTSSGAVAPAQELIRKQRAESGSADHLTAMAQRLRAIREKREAGEGAAA